jgi:integrating conjugative element relaxase (TIGR03760 family)
MLRLLRRGRIGEAEARPPPAGLLEWHDAAGLLADADRQAVIRQIKEAVGVPARHWQELYQVLLDRFAEFVQLLPASENHHHARVGGLLDHSLDVAQKAVAIRRGHLLPPGAEPEVVARQSDRWTFAVFSAALLHDVGKAVLLVQVERLAANGGSLGPWVGWDGAMRGTSRYRFRFAPGRRYHDYPLVGPFLARVLVPEVAIAWLGADVELMSFWIAAVAGDNERGGAVAEIVERADRLSVAGSLGVEEGNLPAASRRAPLHVRLSGALRDLIDASELPINRRGAGAWVFGDELFVVAKRGIDAMREQLLAEGHTDIPTRNDRIMDESPAPPSSRVDEMDAAGEEPAQIGGEATAGEPQEGPAIAGDGSVIDPDDKLPDEGVPVSADAEAREAELPAEPEAFITWVRDGLASGRLRPNRVNALLHVVPEGLLIVSPKAFKVYADEGEGRNWEYVQRRFVRLRWHRFDADRKGILTYEVRGDRKSGRLKGLVVRDPEGRLGVSLPEPNPCLIRLSAM